MVRVFTPEFRRRVVELVRAGRRPETLGREFGISATRIRDWVDQAALDDGVRPDGAPTDEGEELKRLRRENEQLLLETEILKKATDWFARETDSDPPESTDS